MTGRENQRPRLEGPETAIADSAQEAREASPCPSTDKGSQDGASAPPQPLRPIEGKKPSEILLTHLDLNEMGDEQQAAVWTLLKYFKARGL